MPESQKLDKRMQRWELERHITRVKSNNIYILHSLSFHSMWNKKSVIKSDFHSKTKTHSVQCLCYYCNPTDRWFTSRLDKVNIVTRSYSLEATTNAQNNRYCYMIPWLARTIYKYINAFFVFVYFCDTSKASENLIFSLNKVSLCWLFVLL